MAAQSNGAVLLKNGPEYVLGRFAYKTEESAKGFFNHQIFKYSFSNIWPEFKKFHNTLLSKHEQKDQPKSLFVEMGLQVELMDTKRDFGCRSIYRDFVTGPLLSTLSQLGSDGFYDDLHSDSTWVFVDYVYKFIYIDGVKVFKKGTLIKERPLDTPIMTKIKTASSSSPKHFGITYRALDCLTTTPDMIQFYHEMVEWLSKYADRPEDRKNPAQALQRDIGYHFVHFGSSTKQRWRNALDFNYQSITLEFDKYAVVEIPTDF